MGKKTVTVKLVFSYDESDTMSIETEDVPDTIILEALQNLTNFFAQRIVDDAGTVVPKEELDKYLDARIKVDREKLNKLLK
jgi:hypothetical protein